MNERILWRIASIVLVMPLAATAQEGGGYGTRARPNPDELVQAVEKRYEEIDEAALKEPPARDYRIAELPLEKVKLFRADPRLLENKFAADLSLASARIQRMLRQWETVPANKYFDDLKSIVEQCPVDQRPDQRLVAFWTSPEYESMTVFKTPSYGTRPRTEDSANIRIFAPTAKEAEERAGALLKLLDCHARVGQRYHLEEGRKKLEELRRVFAEYEEIERGIPAVEAKLEEPSEITPEILNQLKAQKVMVAVELAGLNARVKACDEMLKDPRKLEVSTLQSVSDMKVKADIERFGIKEKLDQINTFIAEGNQREALQAKIGQMKAKRTSLLRAIITLDRDANGAVDSIFEWSPARIHDNTITIAPVEWTN